MSELNVFICAAGHSGSTLLDLILGSHSHMTSLGEITQLPKNLALNTKCTCGAEIHGCQFWKNVLHETDERLNINATVDPYTLDLGFIDAWVVVDHNKQTRWYDFVRKVTTGATYLNWRYGIPVPLSLVRRYERAMRNNLVLFDAVRKVTGRQVVVDSTKHYLKAVGLYKQRPETTRIILLTRDARGVFFSNLRRGTDRKMSLNSWLLHFSRALPLFTKQVPSSAILQVRYEDLCRDTPATLATICDFLGLTFEESMLDYASHEHHIANGNDMRFVSSSEIRCDERWRSELKQTDVDYFKRHAWKLNRQLGYKD